VLDLSRTTAERLAADLPAAVRDDAAASLAAFESMPMPSETEENWRYVEVPGGLDSLHLPEQPGAEPTTSEVAALLGSLEGRAAIVDGHVVSLDGDHLSRLGDLEEPFAAPQRPSDKFAAAAGAFAGDGVVVRAARNERVARPIYVSMEAVTAPAVSMPRLVVLGAEASEISVVVEQRSPDGGEMLVLPDIAVVAEASARVSVTVVQTWGDHTTSIGSVRYRAERDAFVEMAEAGLGGRFSRLHLITDLAGRGADARITGAYFGDADRTLDYRYFMNHQGPNTTSEMFLKGAVAGHARSVFTGLIRIEPEGQGTNAHQTNRNLVLSDDAEAHSVPNLEILANDVRCGHGSTVGPLDDEQRYYLMSRGLPEPRADRLQVLGFFEEALQRFPVQEIEPLLRAEAMRKYDAVAR
jgi:Fe-S cluster assembly protein SufD